MDSINIKNELEQAIKLPLRERLKAFKAVGYKVSEAFKSNTEPQLKDLDVYIEILKYLINSPDPQVKYHKYLSKIIAKRLELLGCENPKILFKKSGIICLESGHIAIGDYSFARDIDTFIKETKDTPENPVMFKNVTLDMINSGQMFFIGTGGDGYFNFQVRIIESPEPVLTAKEYKCVIGTSPMVVLDFPTGKLAMQDGCLYINFESAFETDIPPGKYKCQVYLFRFPKSTSLYFVLSKTDVPALNLEKEISGFSFC